MLQMLFTVSKSKRLLLTPCLVGLAIMLSAANVAHADWFQTYVAATCDAPSGRGIVRFGYGDADDPPKFALVDSSVDGGLSHISVTNADKTDASCSFPSGREIKVRYVMGPGVADTRGPWSVWVDKIRIIRANALEEFPFAVIIDKHGFRKCRFQLAQGEDLYDLTPGLATPPVKCDKELSPIRGTRDLVEYPMAGSPPVPRAGSILVTSAKDDKLCRSLIVNDRIVADHLGTVIPAWDWGAPTYVYAEGSGDTTHVLSRRLDLTNSGVARNFYQVNSGHTFTRAFFVLPPATVSVDELTRELASASNFWDMPEVARKKGWLVLGWDVAPYRDTPVEFSVIQAAHSTFLLGSPAVEAPDPAAILWKGRRDGTLVEVCVFQSVKPHL
jgi:hypothetical protein